MYIHKGARVAGLIWRDRHALIGLTVAAVLTELLEPFIPKTELFSVAFVSVFSAALSIFLVFRFNESYERWWEARKLWGSVVNLSRDLARQSLTLLDEEGRSRHAPTIIYQQIVFVHALRIRLRHPGSPEGRKELESLLHRLTPEEADQLLEKSNIPTALIVLQSERLSSVLRERPEEALLLTRFDSTWSHLLDAQGACERIKNTVFPDMVSLVTRILVYGLALLLFVSTMGQDGWRGLVATAAVALMAMGYIWIETLGRDLKDPFENRPNDIPIFSISIGIERDLREMLGETDLPEPVKPVKGVLM